MAAGRKAESMYCLLCGGQQTLDLFDPFCPACRAPLLCPPPEKKWKKPPKKYALPLEAYADLLPLDSIEPSFSLGEGGTPLLPLPRLSAACGGACVYAKNETVNPTWSFKDRGMAVAVQKAVSAGSTRIGTVSTGNMAASTAAYGVRAGLRTFVLVKQDTEPEKILSTSVHGPSLIAVEGDYGELFSRSYALGREFDVYFMNSVDPFRIEGYKVTGYEIYEQLGGRAPDYLVVPVSAGGHFIGLVKAFLDLKDQGLITGLPVFVGVQAEGCSPLVRAFRQKLDRFQPFDRPHTVAQSISNASPPGGNMVLKLVRDHGGVLLSVSDPEMLEAQRVLASREGLFSLPASASAAAALAKLHRTRGLSPSDVVVLVLTGTGLKNMRSLEADPLQVQRCSLQDLERCFSRLTDLA